MYVQWESPEEKREKWGRKDYIKKIDEKFPVLEKEINYRFRKESKPHSIDLNTPPPHTRAQTYQRQTAKIKS